MSAAGNREEPKVSEAGRRSGRAGLSEHAKSEAREQSLRQKRSAGASAGKRCAGSGKTTESLRARKERACEIVRRLREEYPDTHCTLAYDEAWKLLVSVRLAAQCTDARVDQITPVLYARFPTISALADASEDAIEEIVRPCGLGRSKARDIKACMTMLRDAYGCEVPDTMEELLRLPGVGRKSANLVLGDIYGKPAIVTDTHCIRLAGRMGLTDGEKDPYKVEKALLQLIPPEESNDFCHRLVDHGRAVCTARTAKPNCDACCIAELCPKRF